MANEAYAKLICVMGEAYKLCKKQPLTDQQKWINIGHLWVRKLNKIVKHHSTLSMGEKLKIQNAIGLLQSLITKFKKHQKRGGSINQSQRGNKVEWRDLQSAYRNRIRTGLIINLDHIDPSAFLLDAQKMFIRRIRNELGKHGNLKVNAILACKFQNWKNEEMHEEMKYFNTENNPILQSTDIQQWFRENIIDKLLVDIEDFQERDSGWTLSEVINLTVNINNYEPLRGGLSTFVELPAKIRSKKAVINIQNSDEFCFLWCITAALHPKNDCVHRVTSYPHFSTCLNYQGIEFPMRLRDVSKFEKINSLSINVYGLDEYQNVVPLHLSKNESVIPTIHLLMIENTEAEADQGDEFDDDFQPIHHFTWIRNLSRLISKQLSKHDGRVWMCDRCLNHFSTEKSFLNHQSDCLLVNKFKMILPKEKDRILKFRNHRYKEPVQFVVYADLESILEPTDCGSTKHIAHSIAYYLHCAFDDDLSKFEMNRGAQYIEWFCKKLEDIAHMVADYTAFIVPMEEFTAEQEEAFESATVCHICNEPFTATSVKHRDHCHFTGRYRGAAHAGCNLNYTKSHIIPVVFHNLSGYDAHFFIKSLATKFSGRINLLPINKEKYISFTKEVDGTETTVKLRFLDSFRFMASSLEKLASYLTDDEKVTTRKFCNEDLEKFQLLTRKGVFPYE